MNALMIYAGMRQYFAQFAKNDAGTTAIEYALIAAGIAMAIITTVYALGEDTLVPMFESISAAF